MRARVSGLAIVSVSMYYRIGCCQPLVVAHYGFEPLIVGIMIAPVDYD